MLFAYSTTRVHHTGQTTEVEARALVPGRLAQSAKLLRSASLASE
jgi:hypothetical protein